MNDFYTAFAITVDAVLGTHSVRTGYFSDITSQDVLLSNNETQLEPFCDFPSVGDTVLNEIPTVPYIMKSFTYWTWLTFCASMCRYGHLIYEECPQILKVW